MSALDYHKSNTKLNIPVANIHGYYMLCISVHFHIQLLPLLLKLPLTSTRTMETDIPLRAVVHWCERIWSAGNLCRNRISQMSKDFPLFLK